MPDYYIARTNDLWLQARLEGGTQVSLPFGLKVHPLAVMGGREHFQILEGVHKGRNGSVAALAGNSYLTRQLAHRPGMLVQFDRNRQTLHFGGQGPVNAFAGGGHGGHLAIATGSYLLAIPDHPARRTRAAYAAFARFHAMWFPIGLDGRFLHPGATSEGGVAVRPFLYDPAAGTPPPSGFANLAHDAQTAPGLVGLPLPAVRAPTSGWDQVVEALILCRESDQAVGRLLVT